MIGSFGTKVKSLTLVNSVLAFNYLPVSLSCTVASVLQRWEDTFVVFVIHIFGAAIVILLNAVNFRKFSSFFNLKHTAWQLSNYYLPRKAAWCHKLWDTF